MVASDDILHPYRSITKQCTIEDFPRRDSMRARAVARTRNQQVGLKESTAAFKKGELDPKTYYEEVLKTSFADTLPEMLPKIMKALPPERAAALKAVAEVI